MTRFLYRFGYETPTQWKANEERGWDDESSSAFWVEADTADEALAWGRDVTEAMVRELFSRSGWRGDVPSWKEAGYAQWIEKTPADDFTADDLASLLVINQGEMPADLGWLIQ